MELHKIPCVPPFHFKAFQVHCWQYIWWTISIQVVCFASIYPDCLLCLYAAPLEHGWGGLGGEVFACQTPAVQEQPTVYLTRCSSSPFQSAATKVIGFHYIQHIYHIQKVFLSTSKVYFTFINAFYCGNNRKPDWHHANKCVTLKGQFWAQIRKPRRADTHRSSLLLQLILTSCLVLCFGIKFIPISKTRGTLMNTLALM